MSIRRFIGFALSILSGLYACQSSDSTLVRTQLKEIDSLRASGLYTEALSAIDSLHSSEAAIIKEVIELKKQIRLEQAEQELVRIEQELSELQKIINLKLNNFQLLGQEPVQWFHHNALIPEVLGERPHLRAMVDSTGALRLVSVYVGSRSVKHSALRISAISNGSNQTTAEVPHDDALNYRYTDGEKHWELVTYTRTSLNNMEDYLGQEVKGGLRIDLLSHDKSVYHYLMPKREQLGLYATIELSKYLKQREDLRREQAMYAQRYLRLNKKGNIG